MNTVIDAHTATGTERTLSERMHALVTRLYPICRSITGEGVRESLRVLGEMIPLTVHKVPPVPTCSIGPFLWSGISETHTWPMSAANGSLTSVGTTFT